MRVENNTILDSVEIHVKDFFERYVSNKYAFHDLQHTRNVVSSIREITAQYEDISEKEIELLELAAWFHDMGYDKGPKDHEERSIQYAKKFLSENKYPSSDIDIIVGCIQATKYPQQPSNFLEQILGDADLSHLGKNIYWDRCGKVRQEMALVGDVIMNEQEWLDFEIKFLNGHKYHSEAAQRLYEKDKQKHIKQLVKQKARLNPTSLTAEEVEILAKKKDKKKKEKAHKKIKSHKQEIKQLRLGRGVETMYRTTYRTHVNLSSIADNKANIMLSINAIIISITVSTLVPSFDTNPKLIIPTIILLGVCLTAIVFATLSTMPKITEGKFTREDIEKKRSNLLFFGNFYNMKLDDFHWGMMEMIKNSDFLYSSMTRDLYYLGIVLAKKYKYLRTCYRIFMFGLIAAVLAFAIAFAF